MLQHRNDDLCLPGFHFIWLLFICFLTSVSWINLRIPFREVFGAVKCNLKEAVEIAGLAWQGRAHCGLDDAKNTAHLLALLMHRGFKFSITNSIMWQTADRPLMWKQSPEQPIVFPHCPYKAKDITTPVVQYHPFCFCGVKSSRGMVRKPGPKQGSLFFGCGNWTATRGACCRYFEWASNWMQLLIYYDQNPKFSYMFYVKKKMKKMRKEERKKKEKVGLWQVVVLFLVEACIPGCVVRFLLLDEV